MLKRSPGTFCDLLNKGQAPKTETGRSVWRIIEEFLDDSEKQEELRLSVAHAERSNFYLNEKLDPFINLKPRYHGKF